MVAGGLTSRSGLGFGFGGGLCRVRESVDIPGTRARSVSENSASETSSLPEYSIVLEGRLPPPMADMFCFLFARGTMGSVGSGELLPSLSSCRIWASVLRWSCSCAML